MRSLGKKRLFLGTTLLLGIALATTTAQAVLIDDFDPANPNVTMTQSGSAPGPVVTPGGPTGNYMRLMDVNSGGQNNRMAFDRAVDGGVSNSLKATYDFRINPSGNPGDGYSIVLLPTATYGNGGDGAGFTAEEPNVGGAFGVGFDLYPGLNNVSLHWNGGQVAEVAVPTGDINLDASVFHRAEVIARHVAGGSNVTVTLTPDVYGTPGTPVTMFNNYFVAGMTPYDYRAQFTARSGGATLDVDLDNISSGVAPGAQPVNTFVDFDGVNTQYKAYTHGTAVHAAVLSDAGSDGNFLRLIHNNVNDERNSLPIDRAADGGVSNSFSGTFDFRADGGTDPADGFSMLLIPTATYGDNGAGASATTWIANRPNVADIFGIGFSFYQASGGVNDVSVHWDGAQIANNRLDPGVFDLDSGVFNRANVIARHVAGGSNVTITLTPDVNGTPGAPVTVFNNLFVPGMVPYDYRMEFAARSGGSNMDVDLDSVSSGTAPSATPGATLQDFDGGGSQYKAYTYAGSRHASIEDVGGNNVLRLLHSVNGESNGVAFDRTSAGLYGTVEADWDFSLLAGADGGAFGLINTGLYDTSGQGPYLSEEPNVAQMFTIGFDVYSNIHDVSLHWNGAELAQVGSYDYRGAGMKHAHAIIDYVAGGANVSMEIDGTPIFSNEFIAGMVPYESRVGFGGRTGGVNTTFELDNVNVQFLDPIALATDPFHWKGLTGNYPDNTKWTNDILPTGNDHAFIELGICNSTDLSVAGTGSLTVSDMGLLNNAGVLRVGASGTAGTMNQSGGIVQTSTDLYVADAGSSGSTYTITGGTLTVGGMHTVVGRGGVGHFIQDGDSTVNLRRLFVSEFGGSDGSTYTLHDGTLNINNSSDWGIQVGRTDDGTFNQYGGTVTVDARVHLGNSSGAVGTYNMTDGSLTLGSYLVLGASGTGIFNQSGGTVTQTGGRVILGDQIDAQGTYNLSGGTLNANALTLADKTGGIATFTISGTGILNSNGNVEVGDIGTGVLNVDGGEANVTGWLRLAPQAGADGIVNQTGGTVTVGSRFEMSDNATATSQYNLSGDGVLTVNNDYFIVGRQGVAHFSQSDTSVVNANISARLLIGDGTGAEGSSYTMTGGTLNVNNGRQLVVGKGGSGAFYQSGGTVNASGRLALASDANARPGRYELSGNAVLNVDGDYFLVGQAGEGTFVQSDSSTVNANLGTEFIVGDWGGAVGDYELSGGTLNVGNGRTIYVGKDGNGHFLQTGGTVNASGRLHVGGRTASDSDYLLEDGTLNVGTHLVVGDSGTGVFTQTGGTVNVLTGGHGLYVGDQSSSDGTYVISGGALNVNALRRGGHAGNRSTFRVIGSDATINVVNEYNLNSADVTVGFDLDSGGISTVNIGSYGNLDGTLEMGIHGGAALWDEPAHTLLSAAGSTLNNDFATKQESIFTTAKVNADKDYVATLNSAFFLGATDTNCGSLGFPLTDAGYVDITLVDDSQPIELLLTASAGSGMAIDDLIGYMAGAGLPAEASTYPGYDIRLLFPPRLGEDLLHFGWDLNGFNAGAGISGLVANVPEPATWSLLVLGLGGLWLFARRRRRS